jgi:hypothetical protein
MKAISGKRSLARFDHLSEVEADSAWQMLQALGGVDDPRLRAELFNHALKEVHHAAILAALERSQNDSLRPYASPERRQLFDPNTGLAAFESVHFARQVSVYDQFFSHTGGETRRHIRHAFLQIHGNKTEHQRLAFEQVVKVVGSEKQAHRLIRRMRRSLRYAQLTRAIRWWSALFGSTIFSALYCLCAPLMCIGYRRRLRETQSVAAADLRPEIAPRCERVSPR